MECLYLENLQKSIFNLEITSDEKKHIKALRIKENEEILVSNGKGLAALAKVHFDKEWNPILEILDYIEDYGEININISLLVCNLSSRERLEIIVEKATELGATEIFIAICKFSQTPKVDLTRLEKKAIAALKQSKRSKLLKISVLQTEDEIQNILSKFKNIILLDEEGSKPLSSRVIGNSIILVGPEGGFHLNEINRFEKIPNLIKWYLGKRRLRTETAALKALSLITSMNE